MATLSADQLTDFRADIANYSTAFTDDQLHRFYTRADSDYNKAIVLAFRQLLAEATKLYDYRLAQSSESRAQIFEHIKGMLTYWEGVAQTKQQVKIVGMRAIPPRAKGEPSD